MLILKWKYLLELESNDDPPQTGGWKATRSSWLLHCSSRFQPGVYCQLLHADPLLLPEMTSRSFWICSLCAFSHSLSHPLIRTILFSFFFLFFLFLSFFFFQIHNVLVCILYVTGCGYKGSFDFKPLSFSVQFYYLLAWKILVTPYISNYNELY